MATIDVKDAAGATVAIEKPLTPGRAAATSSRPVALSNEDKTALDALVTAAQDTTTPSPVGGAIAHDAADSGNPLLLGAHALAHGANPTAVAAADRTRLYANRHGIPWVIGGHPNVIARGHIVADADGAQTDYALSGTVAAGTKWVITQLSVKADKANSGNTAVTIGFGTANTPVPDLDGTDGVLLSGSFGAGEGHQIGDGSGIIGVGADGAELRMTCGDPAGGNLRISYSYYTIES